MLKLNKITVKFGDKTVLNQLQLSFAPGTIVGLVAPNGTGKSTLMNVMMNYLRPTAGSVTYQETFNYKTKKNEVKMHQKISAFPEQGDLYADLSGYDHLVIYAKMWGNPLSLVEETIQRLEMSHYVKKKTKTYSLGMKQRLCFAMQLVTNTEVMLMDEVMNGLDPNNTSLISQILVELRAQGKTIIIASHLLDNLESYADRVLFLAGGEIIYQRDYPLAPTEPIFLKLELERGQLKLIQEYSLLADLNFKQLAEGTYVSELSLAQQENLPVLITQLLNFKITNFKLAPLSLNELYAIYYIN